MLTRYRYPNWYWGRYITKQGRTKWVDESGKEYPSTKVNLSEMEIYEEEKHGWKNSEEARNQNSNLSLKKENGGRN